MGGVGAHARTAGLSGRDHAWERSGSGPDLGGWTRWRGAAANGDAARLKPSQRALFSCRTFSTCKPDAEPNNDAQ